MRTLALALCTLFFVFSITNMAYAVSVTWEEVGDAGELIDTAQITHGKGSLEYIFGNLTEYDNIDMYKIYIKNTNKFSVTVWADLSYDNDAVLYLFDSEGFEVLRDDDGSGNSLLPQINPGQILGEDSGIYYLAFTLFGTWPNSDDNGLVSWDYTMSHQQGQYILDLTRTSPAASAPVLEPATILLFGSGLIGLAAIRKRFRPDIS